MQQKYLNSCKHATYVVKMQLLEDVLGSKNKIKIIRFLLKRKNWEFNITELSKDLGINKGNISNLVKELEKNDILTVNKKGKILLFKLTDNFLVRNILEPLFNKESSFFEQYTNKIKNVCKTDKNIISVILYGSVASDKANLKSDIDIFIITNNKKTDIKEKIRSITDEILINVDIISLIELRKAYYEKEPLIKNILNSHKILYGKNILDII